MPRTINSRGQARDIVRQNLLNHQQGKCAYCLKIMLQNEITNDHVVPRSKGGTKSLANIVLACFDCNQLKGSHYWSPKISPAYVSVNGQSQLRGGLDV